MPICEHRVKVEATDNILKLPEPTDPRLSPWIDQLVGMGVMTEKLELLYPTDCTSGVLGTIDTITGGNEAFYFWRVEWEEEHAHKE